MADPVAITLSALALAVSVVTAWLTLFRRGTVKMTQPTVIYFGADTPRTPGDAVPPKVYLRTLLFSTSKRGRVIESMHVRLSRNEAHQNFNIWVHGYDEKLVRGSGFYVGETGVAANHHFLVPRDASAFRFAAGRYRMEVFAHVLGDRDRKLLFAQDLEVTPEEARQLEEPATGLYFDWGPDSSRYHSHIDKRLQSPSPLTVLAQLGLAERRERSLSTPRE